MSDGRDKHIRITVGPDGDLTFAPSYAHVDSGQFVTWEVVGEKASLLVVLDDAEAFGDATEGYRSDLPAEAREELRRAAECRAAVELRAQERPAAALAIKPGIYHYRVALSVAGQLYADVWCPTVIVR